MENSGLLFIPDISGFTRFIAGTEISHSRLIIQELLETLINSNQIGLKVSEIEGDAILFYKFGESAKLEDLYKQVERMFCEFHGRLLAYDHTRFCQCKACASAVNLSLKVITHYGEFTSYTVKEFQKLIGKDIIVAHQLLKNDIPEHEYWLVTNSLYSSGTPLSLTEWMQWNFSSKETENGKIPFYYTQLGALKDSIAKFSLPKAEIEKRTRVLSVTGEYETDIRTLFHATGDFSYRPRWFEGVLAVEDVNHFLPRVGMQCKCIMKNKTVFIYSDSYSYHPERIEFTETENILSRKFVLEKINPGNTRVTIDIFISPGLAGITLFKIFKKKIMEKALSRSLQRLTTLTKEISLPGLES